MKTENRVAEELRELISALVRGDEVHDLQENSATEEVTLEGDAAFRVAIRVLSWVLGKEQP